MAMSFFDLIATRHSVRVFEDKPIPDDMMQGILNAAVSAPSAGNLQSYRILVIRKKEIKMQIVSAVHGQDFVGDAAALFVFCADPTISSTEYGVRGTELYCIQDATIACTFAQLAAHSLGLGTVWVGSFDEEELSKILRISQHLRPVAILVAGYAAAKPEITPRKPLGEISHII